MTTIIVGGGWSGLAAAIELSQYDESIILLEAAKQLGGRARNTQWHDLTLDNGQHILIGAYQQTLSLFDKMGLDPNTFFQRTPLDLTIHNPHYPSLRLRRQSWLPWPFSLLYNLIRDNGFAITQQLFSLVRSASRFDEKQDKTVIDWLEQCRQSPRLIRQLWEPLCLATLNTPIQQASANIFAQTLVTIFQRAEYSDLLLARCPLGNTLPYATARYLEQQGHIIELQSRVKKLLIEHNTVRGVELEKGKILAAENVILACQPENTARLINDHLNDSVLASFPICTVYLKFPTSVRLQQPVIGLSGGVSQWLFDRSAQTPGLMAVVISGPGEHETLSRQDLSEQVYQEIKPWLSDPVAQLESSLVIREKRATFASSVDIHRQRPNNRTEISGLWLAGDIVNNPYPATLEGAVSNGIQTARQLAEQLTRCR